MIEIISPAYKTYPIIVPSLILQTNPNWTLKIIHDGKNDNFINLMKGYPDPRIIVGNTNVAENVWGHNIRKMILRDMQDDGDYVIITNHDNYAFPCLIDEVTKRNEDMLCWSIAHNYYDYSILHPRFEFGGIDLFQVAVKKKIAKEVGWECYENPSDWLYIMKCCEKANSIHFINKILGVHN